MEEAIRLAKATGGKLMLVHVVDELVTADYAPSIYYDRIVISLRKAGVEAIEDAAAIVRRADVPFKQKLVESFGGRPADAIVREAKEWPADLIALGTHGRRGLKRLALGSDAELVLRLSSIPVLMVRGQAEAP